MIPKFLAYNRQGRVTVAMKNNEGGTSYAGERKKQLSKGKNSVANEC